MLVPARLERDAHPAPSRRFHTGRELGAKRFVANTRPAVGPGALQSFLQELRTNATGARARLRSCRAGWQPLAPALWLVRPCVGTQLRKAQVTTGKMPCEKSRLRAYASGGMWVWLGVFVSRSVFTFFGLPFNLRLRDVYVHAGLKVLLVENRPKKIL